MAGDAQPTPILAHLFLGSKAHARDRALLEKLQITHILNVTPPKTMDPVAGVPNFFEKDKKLTYRRCPIFDNKAEDISGVLEGCIAFMDQAKYYGRILVHCNKGVSRSTSMVIAYLMKIKGMSFDEALQFVTEKRPVANPNASFRRQLQEYGQKLRCTTAVSSKGKSAIGAAVRGLQGPSLPPPQREEKTKPSSPKGSNRGSIGPQLPPHLQKKMVVEDGKQEDETKGGSETNGASSDGGSTSTTTEVVAEEPVIIGPSFPPSHKRSHYEATQDDDDEATNSPRKNAKTVKEGE